MVHLAPMRRLTEIMVRSAFGRLSLGRTDQSFPAVFGERYHGGRGCGASSAFGITTGSPFRWWPRLFVVPRSIQSLCSCFHVLQNIDATVIFLIVVVSEVDADFRGQVVSSSPVSSAFLAASVSG